MTFNDWPQIHTHILQFEQEGLVTRTFRRLDPDRQQAILSAILDEAIEKGPTSLNIKQVAERAGVAVGSLYAYFGNRDGLLNFAVELCVRYMADMFAYFETYLEQMPLREALTAYLTGGVEWSQTQTGLVHFFVRAAYHGDPEMAERVVRPIANTMRQMMHGILTRAIEHGEIRADVDLDTVTRLINALMIAVGDSQIMPYLNTYFQVTDDEVSPERLLEALLDFILRGIGP
ncbi:MAG: TetR/AcrR family transcriptional regulator [Anaerolineae bacterium]|nr:TetR/AcrR family transcriptional regulator [Anaerolineae bacterium]